MKAVSSLLLTLFCRWCLHIIFLDRKKQTHLFQGDFWHTQCLLDVTTSYRIKGVSCNIVFLGLDHTWKECIVEWIQEIWCYSLSPVFVLIDTFLCACHLWNMQFWLMFAEPKLNWQLAGMDRTQRANTHFQRVLCLLLDLCWF